MIRKMLLVGILIFVNSCLISSNVKLLYKITKESKENPKFKSLVKSDSKVNTEKIENYNLFYLSENNVIINSDSLNNSRIVYDFNQEIKVTYNKLTNLYSRVPLYSLIHYRISEFQNRIGLNDALFAGGVNDAFGNLFSRESLFGLEIKPDSLKSDIKRKEKQKINTVMYNYNKENIVTIKYSTYPIKENFKIIYEKFLIYNFYLHPIIIRDIINYGYIPQYIEYNYINMSTETKIKMDLLKFDIIESSFPELTDFSIVPVDTTSSDSLINLINKVYDRVLKGNIELIDKKNCINYSNELIKNEKYLDALLCLMEYLLQSGDKLTDAIQNAMSYSEKDENLKTFIYCLQSKIPSKDKLAKLSGFPQEKYIKGYLLNIFISNYYNNNEIEKSLNCFNKVLLRSQYITGVYKDLGDLYAKKYDMETAWKCYDIALLINRQYSSLKDLGLLKSNLKDNFPVYFLEEN